MSRTLAIVANAFLAAVGRLDKSFSPKDTLAAVRRHAFTWVDSIYLFHLALASFWLTIMEVPGFPYKLFIPLLYALALLIPFTSQFFVPATPIFQYLLSFYSSRFIPVTWRPSISVVLLPTLESVLYGANISDTLTRFTHPILDLLAWLPYGVLHYTLPFIVAAFLWLFRPKEALHLWARAFGYMSLIGVLTQDILPCAAPWYEVIYGLTPAHYNVPGSPAGLGRIDALFNSNGYTAAFSHSPVVFGAFPSLHAADGTLAALFLSHFFPQTTRYIWLYVGVLYWSTMYLTHHYLIDVVAGACLATACFYFFLPDELKGSAALASPGGLPGYRQGTQRSKYDIYDLEAPLRGRGNGSSMMDAHDFELSDTSSHASDEEVDITYRSPVPTPMSAMPFMHGGDDSGKRKGVKTGTGKVQRGHKHTASIASLIRGDERSGEGWSPIATTGFVFPPTPTRADLNTRV